MTFLQDTHFPSLIAKRERREEEKINPVTKEKCWRRRVDVNMSYYFGLLMFLFLLNVIFKYPLKEVVGVEADIFRSSVTLPWVLQLSFGHTQLMIIVGLCLDGGKSWTSLILRVVIQSFGHLLAFTTRWQKHVVHYSLNIM